eukprot:4035470-Alexandrium_andersonii.AAC.1
MCRFRGGQLRISVHTRFKRNQGAKQLIRTLAAEGQLLRQRTAQEQLRISFQTRSKRRHCNEQPLRAWAA